MDPATLPTPTQRACDEAPASSGRTPGSDSRMGSAGGYDAAVANTGQADSVVPLRCIVVRGPQGIGHVGMSHHIPGTSLGSRAESEWRMEVRKSNAERIE